MNLKSEHMFLLFFFIISFCDGIPSSFLVFQFGSDGPEPVGGEDYLLWEHDAFPDGNFPKQFSVCFNIKYQTMDYWSSDQKTILHIFQESLENFWIRVNNSPPRGTMILNSGTLWSGGLGSYRYDDLAYLTWSCICLGVDFTLCHLIYFIDGRKVADEDLVDTWKDFCRGVDPPFPTTIDKIKSGQNMVGFLTHINMFGTMLSDDEMKKITSCELYKPGDFINWEESKFTIVGNINSVNNSLSYENI